MSTTIKYKTSYDSSIKPYEVVKETEKRITYKKEYTDWNDVKQIKDETENKSSNYHNWHDTFSDAKFFLLNRSNVKIAHLEEQIKNERDNINIVNALKQIESNE